MQALHVLPCLARNNCVLPNGIKQVGKYHQHFEELLPMDLTGMAFLTSAYHISDQEARKTLGMFGLDGARHLVRIGELR